MPFIHLPSPTLLRVTALPLRRSQQLPDLEQITLQTIHEASGLPMLAACADADGVVLDDVADTEAVAGDGAEAKVAERRVAAVGGAEDGVVDLLPPGIHEEGGHLAGATDAGVVIGRGAVVTRGRPPRAGIIAIS